MIIPIIWKPSFVLQTWPVKRSPSGHTEWFGWDWSFSGQTR